jgi:hypothetical protein
MRKFRFTEKTLKKFDSIFPYEGQLEDGLWVYNNPFKLKYPKKQEKFFVQVGFGKVMYVDGWSPDGMTLKQIIEKLKK